MTREEYNDFANALKNNYTIDFDKLPEFCDMAISVLSAEGECIKKEDLFNKTIKRNSIWNEITNAEGKGLEEIVNDLPTYSFPNSKSVINKVIEVIEKDEFETIDGFASSAPILSDSDKKLCEANIEAYEWVLSAVKKYRDSNSADDNTMEWLENEDGSYECSKCHMTRSGLISGVFNFCPNCGRKAVQK